MDIDVAENVTFNETSFEGHEYVHHVPWVVRLLLETFAITCLLNCAVSVFISCAILKSKRLRNQVQNIYILHWNILNAIYYLWTPNLARLLVEDVTFTFSTHIYMISLDVQATILICEQIFVIILAYDWLCYVYYPNFSKIFRKYHRLPIAMTYILGVIILALFLSLTFTYYVFIPVGHCFLFISYIVVLVMILVVDLVHLVKKRHSGPTTKTNFGLKTANVYVLCWLPSFVSLCIATFARLYHFTFLSILTAYVGLSNPLINLFLFYFWDKDYKTAFLGIIRCSKYTSTIDTENLVDDDEINENSRVAYRNGDNREDNTSDKVFVL